ncbi:TPA: hypothetical protein DIV48_01755 [Candidatus Kaiserbacteria bacterium]|nr:hypothetical protein [Candidatus Kaiserbacteria bacterium]
MQKLGKGLQQSAINGPVNAPNGATPADSPVKAIAPKKSKSRSKGDDKSKTVPATAVAVSSTSGGATWRHFGADKAYTSRAAAIADAPRVLRQAGYPEPVVSLLTEAMQKPGTATHVTNGMKLDFMRSGKSALWRNVAVQFEKPPMKESMEYAAPSEEWTVEFDGTTWTVGIPKVCQNIYGKKALSRIVSAPAAAPKPYVTSECPQGWTYRTLIYSLSSPKMTDTLRAAVKAQIDAAKKRITDGSSLNLYLTDALSRTLGTRLWDEMRTDTAKIDGDIVLSYLNEDFASGKLQPQPLGVIHLKNGKGIFRFAEDPRSHSGIDTVWPDEVLSPLPSGVGNDVRPRIRFHKSEILTCKFFSVGIAP